MPGYDIRAYLSMQSAYIDKPTDTASKSASASASAANVTSTTTTATTTTTTEQQQRQQHGTTTPRTPRHSDISSALPPRRHLPWLHGTKTPSTSAKKSPRTPRTVRTAEGADLTPTTAISTTTTTTTSTTAGNAYTMSATATPSFLRHASSSHYTPRGGGSSSGGRRGRFTSTTPRGGGGRRGGGRGGANNGTPRGRFEHNTWYCDCREGERNLLLPAERFRVKKEGPNKGRLFYVCQRKQGDERRCGFFLWEEDAKARMEEAGRAAGRAGEEQPHPQPQPRSQPQAGGGVDGSSGFGIGKTASGGGGAAAAKRKWQEEVDGEGETTEDEDGDDDDYGWGKDVGVEDAIGKALDAVSTPSRKVLKRNEGATPGGGSGMVMTPISQRGNDGAKATPKSVRISTATPFTRGGVGDDDAGDLVPDVLQVLNESGVNLDKEAGEALQRVLKSHTLRMQGLVRGRDISRLAVRERNAKIGELQARVTALEAELETQKAVVANLNWQKQTGQFE